ncbi:hypothetical protein OPQ81_010680 [Rhizoctonia solani]|nr:hypothetical protein OPQ81_010680 [Rhizoctonia solani]
MCTRDGGPANGTPHDVGLITQDARPHGGSNLTPYESKVSLFLGERKESDYWLLGFGNTLRFLWHYEGSVELHRESNMA